MRSSILAIISMESRSVLIVGTGGVCVRYFALLDVWSEALVEVAHADESHNNGNNKQGEGKGGKGCERVSYWGVLILSTRVPHAHQLEDEVSHTGEVNSDNPALANIALAAGDVGGQKQKGDSHREGDTGDDDLGESGAFSDDNKELDCEAEEKEEIELEEGDVDLKGRQQDDCGQRSRV